MIKSYFNWSGGKDSSLALYKVLKAKKYSVEKLLTNVNEGFGRVSMHGVREELMDKQAEEIGISLEKLYLPEQPSMVQYAEIMSRKVVEMKEKGLATSIFGDIFLENLKKYRERELAKDDVKGYFPIWKHDTSQILQEFLDLGFKAIVVCVKAEVLDESFAGRIIDDNFVNDLPSNVDPCGENGEFHTFVFDGPIFSKPIPIIVGETVYREYKRPKEKEEGCNPPPSKNMGFWFTDLELKVN